MSCFVSYTHADRLRLVFLGDSLTSGYTLDPDLSYPSLIQKRIDEENLPFEVINAGLNADTTEGGLNRLEWLLRDRIDVLVVALGFNDGFRGFNPSVPEKNLAAIFENTKAAYPDCVILMTGVKLPLSFGKKYIEEFESIFPALSEKYQVPLLPFLLEDVAGIPTLNMSDGIHPTAEGQRIISRHIWTFIEPTLQQVAATKIKQSTTGPKK